jgi:hypothetical protein
VIQMLVHQPLAVGQRGALGALQIGQKGEAQR